MGVLVTGAWPMSQPIFSDQHYRPCRFESGVKNEFPCQCQSPAPILKPNNRLIPSQQTRPSVFFPWAKTKNVIKKIQRKMKIGVGGDGISPNNMPPLLFHSVHGDNISLSNDGTVARRNSSFCKGIAFSNRPVKVKEKVFIKFADVSSNWTGALRFGFTNKDPRLLRGELPKYAYPDLTSKPGFWAKALEDSSVKKGAILSYYVNSAGDIQFEINGEEQKLFLSGVDTRRPVWALFDVYGNTTGIELVDPRDHLNNSKKIVNEFANSSGEEAEMTLMTSMSSMNLRPCAERVSTPLQNPTATAISQKEIYKRRSAGILNSTHTHTQVQDISPMHSNYSLECVVCCEGPVDSVFYSCGHMCMCFQCATEYWKTKEKRTCPICRATILDVMRIYKS